MKLLILLLPILTSFSAYSRPCAVYGISDSPQRLSCHFPQLTVKLSCQRGTYYLNENKVNLAFHMDVEEGSVPLIFKSSGMTLTVMMGPIIQAELQMDKTEMNGTCK